MGIYRRIDLLICTKLVRKIEQKKSRKLSMSEAQLKQLIREGKATIFCIYGTNRSGSTIAEVIFSQLVDISIHQPFRGINDRWGGPFIANKLPFYLDIYNATCSLIVEKIMEVLQYKTHARVLVKEISRFFYPQILEKWIQIPDKFLLTIREPHLQHFSLLSYICYALSEKDARVMSNPYLVVEKIRETESAVIESIQPAWPSATAISYNLQVWQNLIHNWNVLRSTVTGSGKKLAVLDSILLRQNPEYAIGKTIKQLGFEIDNVESFCYNLLAKSRNKIVDLRESNRLIVKKARNSNEINSLLSGEAIAPSTFPERSREHIWQLVPLYLDLLYAPENVSLPSPQQVNAAVKGSETLKLADIHPFVAYAIARFHQQKNPSPEIDSLLDSIINGKTKTILGEEKPNSVFGESFAVVDAYWQKANFNS